MNAIERQIVAHLRVMAQNYGATGVKAEFEAEGTTLEEFNRLSRLAASANLGMTLKIGGAEDVWGILQGRLAGASGIVAPMVESPYALSKFVAAVQKHVPDDEREEILLAVNVETGLAYDNLDAILGEAKSGGLDAVTLGRVDFVGSLGLGRNKIESQEIFTITEDICSRVKKAGLCMTMGGSIEVGTLPVIRKLADQKLLDRFETRKIIFGIDTASDRGVYEDAIRAAHLFECLWLDNLKTLYTARVNQHAERIPLLRKRIAVTGE